jgi:hypothetical protein
MQEPKTIPMDTDAFKVIDRLKIQLVCGDASEILRAVGVPFQDFPGSVGIAALDEGDHMILNFEGFQIKVSFEKLKAGTDAPTETDTGLVLPTPTE